MKWQELASSSPYRTAVAVDEAMSRGEIADAKVGIQELIEALSRSDKRALRSHMIRLMAHIIKWKAQPESRSRSWRATIYNARREIAEIQEDTPSLNRTVINAMWNSCFTSAKAEAEGEMNQDASVTSLSWEEIFEQDYDIDSREESPVTFPYDTRLPPDLRALKVEIEAHARQFGLDFYETIFEVVEADDLNEIASYGGFPTRYPHWSFGMSYEELKKGYEYGLSKIYEMVINNDPCYAYLMRCNHTVDQKLVMAHVYGHCDFFKNNAYFAHTSRKMMDEMANHGARINHYVEKFGETEVEAFIDRCMSVDDLIDIHSTAIKRHEEHSRYDFKETVDEGQKQTRFQSKDYMSDYINPPAVLKAEEEKHKKEQQAIERSFPERPEKDVLLFLIEFAPLKPWQRDVLSIIRDEAYYFTPQGQTKVLNEGWASFWHSTIMTERALEAWECIDYADHHSGTMAMSRGRLNPYKLGIELLRDVERRWNTGQFGKEWEECDNLDKKRDWNLNLGLGRQKIFEVRKIHNDITFIDTFLTPEFCQEHKLFSFAHNEQQNNYVIESREFQTVKQRLLFSLTNFGKPFIYVIDGNYRNRGELLLRHEYNGIELRMDRAVDTLANLQALWSRPVHLQTIVDNKPILITHDGSSPSQKNLGEADDPRKNTPPATN